MDTLTTQIAYRIGKIRQLATIEFINRHMGEAMNSVQESTDGTIRAIHEDVEASQVKIESRLKKR